MPIIGTCSTCGGPVARDMEGVGHCLSCGATEQHQFGRIIPMGPPIEPWPKGEPKKDRSNEPPVVR
jgi:hypothetical protein